MDNKQWRIKESLIKNFRILKKLYQNNIIILSGQMGIRKTRQAWLSLNLWKKETKCAWTDNEVYFSNYKMILQLMIKSSRNEKGSYYCSWLIRLGLLLSGFSKKWKI